MMIQLGFKGFYRLKTIMRSRSHVLRFVFWSQGSAFFIGRTRTEHTQTTSDITRHGANTSEIENA